MPRPPAPKPDAVPDTAAPLNEDSFAHRLERLGGAWVAPPARIALAVSGGGDSLALLWLAARALGPRAVVLSVDHGLRPEAVAECAAVAAIAAGSGLPHATIRLESPPAGSSLQAQARAARYAAMARWCRARGINVLLTAHHADDQAETLLLRLARGSGMAGLSAIRPAQRLEGLLVLRPLLGWRRAELRACIEGTGWPVADDPSNSDPRFDRTRARALLAQTPWLDAGRLGASATHLQQAEEALAWAAERAAASRIETDGPALLVDPEGLPAELKRRLLLAAIARLGAVQPRGPALARLLDRLESGGVGTLGTGTDGPCKAEALADGRWRIFPAPARRPTSG